MHVTCPAASHAGGSALGGSTTARLYFSEPHVPPAMWLSGKHHGPCLSMTQSSPVLREPRPGGERPSEPCGEVRCEADLVRAPYGSPSKRVFSWPLPTAPSEPSRGPEQARVTSCHPEPLPGRPGPHRWTHSSHVRCASGTGEDRTCGAGAVGD